jgi:histidine triad (HIT) family protein
MNPGQSNPDCVFCKIISGEIPSKIIHKDKDIAVFADIKPAAPLHLLVVPVKHIPSLADIKEKADMLLVGKMVAVANNIAGEQGLANKGYRLIINNGRDAGQEVPHLHIHLLGGRPLKWDN